MNKHPLVDIVEQSQALYGLATIQNRMGSHERLWSWGLHEGLVTEQEYKRAREFYAETWNYAGD